MKGGGREQKFQHEFSITLLKAVQLKKKLNNVTLKGISHKVIARKTPFLTGDMFFLSYQVLSQFEK